MAELTSLVEIFEPEPRTVLFDTLTFPAYAAGLSILTLLLQLTFRSALAQRLVGRRSKSTVILGDGYGEQVIASERPSTTARRIAQVGGPVIFTFRIARLLSCFVLLGMSLSTISRRSPDNPARLWLQIAICAAYAYACLLSVLSVTISSNLGKQITRHLLFVLLVIWGVYAYRNVWPLATYTLVPQDGSEGGLLWAKIAILTFVAIIVPLFVPRQYVPIDPNNPWNPIPEQTTSIISMVLFVWLDKIVWTARRVAHLSVDDLPALADYDSARHLVDRSIKHLDPFELKKDRHLFWGLMRVFHTEYIIMTIMVTLQAFGQLASPVAINQLLRYLETDGEGAFIRPWFWIGWLFLGSVLVSFTAQWYVFIGTRMTTRATSMITQLVFEHALRIRVKADVADAPHGEVDRESQQINPDPSSSDGDTSRTSAAIAGSSVKGNQKVKTAPRNKNDKSTSARFRPANNGKGKNLLGKINNLSTSDLANIIGGCDFLFVILSIPLQICLCIWFLYTILGWSAFVSMAVMILLLPAPGYIASQMESVQAEKMNKTDARVQDVTETINVVRMVKLFGWEPRVLEQLSKKREVELRYQWKYKVLDLSNAILNRIIPFVTMIVTFFTYTVYMKRELTASTVFSSIAVFGVMRQGLQRILSLLSQIIRAKVSLDRANEFLHNTELLDQYTQEEAQRVPSEQYQDSHSQVIGIRHAMFRWSSDISDQSATGPTTRNFTLSIDKEVLFQSGHINIIVGPTGSGKTSLLMALLGEMHYFPLDADSFCSLPHAGGVAYAVQESWVQNETIRDNILFGTPYDEERYNKVIDQCDLQRDLSLFDAGDQTEVGEKGLTLSGGQKARITLARAVYSKAEILLLDDVLASLDTHTSRRIIDRCFKGDLIRGRTVLLVTHNIAMATPVADLVISLGADGTILSQVSLSKALAKDKRLSAEAQEAIELDNVKDAIMDDEPVADFKKPDGKLIVTEEVSVGQIGRPAWSMFFASLGGAHEYLFWILCTGTLVLSELSETLQTWFLGYWARQYEEHDPSEVKVPFFLTVYAVLLLGTALFYSISYVFYVSGTVRASRTIHKTLVTSVFGATLRWLDMTPTSRIITRCTQDIQAVDESITDSFRTLAQQSISMLVKLCAIVVVSPLLLFPGVLIAMVGAWCGQAYVKAQLSVKREMSNARSPVLGHFGGAVAGLVSIRAYGAQEMFRQEAYSRLDRWTRVTRTFWNLNRWIGVRMELLSAFFLSSLAAYLVYGGRFNASNVGFLLNMAAGLSGMILWWVRNFNQFEISGNSLERIEQYIQIEQEARSTKDGVPPAYWPASGDLRVEHLSARYSPDGPHVLQNVSFEIKSGEHLGIVGRTGSGKSSLALSLLRGIITEGKVYYDGLPTDTLNIDALRSNITIIPQVPELLSGTLRHNLDPFGQHDDAVLNDALRAAGLFALQKETDQGRIALDSQIANGGGNLSVGQRQILALARAMVRQSKLLILDEATSAIDHATDTVIRTSLREELGKDVTVIIIAHRLHTVMNADKIMVLDAGRIVEFGKPRELLKLEKGKFKGLVDECDDKEALYAMAL